MSIHYKFKSNLNFDTLTFDGVQISVSDLKKLIIKQKKLGKITDFDLQVTNAQTKEVYTSDSALIPKNTSLIISRVPTNNGNKKVFENHTENIRSSKIESKIDGSLDLTQLKASEEEKIQAMMMQSTADYDPKSYYKIKPQSQVGEVPPTYKCNKCKKGGHWIKNCPFIATKEITEFKRNTGIPMSFREKKDMIEECVSIKENIIEKSIPDELICGICKDLFVDAVMIPCCGSSFCDDCVRTALLESDENECPDCKEKGSSPASLIPNRFLRNSVNAFRNENGYSSEKNANPSTLKKEYLDSSELKATTTKIEELQSIDNTESTNLAFESTKIMNAMEIFEKSEPTTTTEPTLITDETNKEKNGVQNEGLSAIVQMSIEPPIEIVQNEGQEKEVVMPNIEKHTMLSEQNNKVIEANNDYPTILEESKVSRPPDEIIQSIAPMLEINKETEPLTTSTMESTIQPAMQTITQPTAESAKLPSKQSVEQLTQNTVEGATQSAAVLAIQSIGVPLTNETHSTQAITAPLTHNVTVAYTKTGNFSQTQSSPKPSPQATNQSSARSTMQCSTQFLSQPSAQPLSQPTTQHLLQPLTQVSVQPQSPSSSLTSTQTLSQPQLTSTQPLPQPPTLTSAQPLIQSSALPSTHPATQSAIQTTIQSTQSMPPTIQPTIQQAIQPIMQASMQPTMHLCDPSFKSIRAFNQFPPLQPQPLNTFDNIYNRIRPIGPMQYHPNIRPRMEPMPPEYYPQNPHPTNAKKNPGHVQINMFTGIPQNIGNGIIDDPLEAFNRIMEEKEKEKRRTKQRRSRSKERQKRWYHRSPSYERRSRRLSVSMEKRVPRDDYHNRSSNRENHTTNFNRYRRSNSITMSRSRSKSLNRQHSRSPKTKRMNDFRRRNDAKDRSDRKNWNDRSLDLRRDTVTVKTSNRINDSMRQPSPPGSDKYSLKSRRSRSRSISPENHKKYRKKSPELKKDDFHNKHKNARKDVHQNNVNEKEELLHSHNVRDTTTPSFHNTDKLKDIIANEEAVKDFNLFEKRLGDAKIKGEEDKDKFMPKDGCKKDKKSKDRKKKKKEKLEKSEKKKNKKLKKDKKNRKSSEKGPNGTPEKDVSVDFTPEKQEQIKSVFLETSANSSLTPPKHGTQKLMLDTHKPLDGNNVMDKQMATKENARNGSEKTHEIEKKSRTIMEVSEAAKHSNNPVEVKLKSCIEMPHNSTISKEDSQKSKCRKSVERRFESDRKYSKEYVKKESHLYQSKTLLNRRDKIRDESNKSHRYNHDHLKTHQKPFESFEIKSVASKFNWNPRPDNPFRRNRINDNFETRHSYRRRLNSTNMSSASDTLSETDDIKKRSRVEKREKVKRRSKYSSSEESGTSPKRKSLKNKKKHKSLKKKKKSRE